MADAARHPINDWKTTTVVIRSEGEWGTFFVRESPVTARDGGGFNASAEWTANTSFGVYGHYWSSMGQPFGKFIQGVKEDYLLSKIGKQEIDDKLVIAGIKKLVCEYRKGAPASITAEGAREAIDTIDEIAGEHSGEVLCNELYQASELSFIQDWDFETRSYCNQAVVFVRKLWPEFVKQFVRSMECQTLPVQSS